MKRLRHINIFSISILLIFLLSGCSKEAENQNKSFSISKKKDKQVVIAIDTEPTTLDPTQGWGHGSAPLLHSTLVEYLPDMTFQYDLAREYSLSQDGLTWTFHMREDVYFTDGEQLTAEDVAFTFDKAKVSQSSLDLTFMKQVEVMDDFTVAFHLSKPTATFLNTLASVGIVPAHGYDQDYGMNPIGSGPFQFVGWNKGEQLILKANEAYYREVPQVEEVVLVFMGEDSAFAAAKAGQVDVALVSPSIAYNQEIEGYHLEEVTSMDNRGITLPLEARKGNSTESGYPVGNDVTSDIAIRKALAYGIDREQIAVDAVYGYGDPAYSENDGMPWNNAEVKIETDLTYAIQLLENSGWVDKDGDGIREKNGIKAEFTCIYPSGDSLRQSVAMAAAQQAKNLGIHMIVEGTSWDDISKRMFTDAVLMGWGSSNPYTSYSLFHSDNKLKDDYYNPEGFHNETVDGYLSKAMEALTVEESYKYWKLAQWDGSTGTSMKGDCPWVWLVNIKHLYFVRDGLDIGEQQLHEHGASMTLLQNLKQWYWK